MCDVIKTGKWNDLCDVIKTFHFPVFKKKWTKKKKMNKNEQKKKK
jgi:hypothetical protein